MTDINFFRADPKGLQIVTAVPESIYSYRQCHHDSLVTHYLVYATRTPPTSYESSSSPSSSSFSSPDSEDSAPAIAAPPVAPVITPQQSHFKHDQTQQIHKGKKRPRCETLSESMEADRATRQCVSCEQMLDKAAFTEHRWYKSKPNALLCNLCIEEGKTAKKQPQTKRCAHW